MRGPFFGLRGAAPLVVLGFSISWLLCGCQSPPETYPFPAGWRSLAEPELVMTVEGGGKATLGGVPQHAPSCEGEPNGWTPGPATWRGVGKGQFEVASSMRPGASLFVQAKTPFGSVEWGTIYVGLCGRDSSEDQWIELKGGLERTGQTYQVD